MYFGGGTNFIYLVYFAFAAHLNLYKPKSKCCIAIWSSWLLY